MFLSAYFEGTKKIMLYVMRKNVVTYSSVSDQYKRSAHHVGATGPPLHCLKFLLVKA